ncbi:tetratricopeptide repeat protein [Dyadobacter psychrotolerans]|uniref:tetratricopeptide repeat protein n=1 Tax=Dyadobacter psychrotolerans TaxID=2541721 RepID=UPI00140485CE|nr:tetratricopeptide repeat protein [Dyadobacter psychrotolerans]
MIILYGFFLPEVFSQDSLSVREGQEIQLLARRKVEKGLNDLLNTISFEDLGDFERKALRTDSYGNSVNKVFYNDKVIIEDDINPEHISGKTGTDLPIDRYLSDFELFYPKSVDRTILFTDFDVSALKKSEYYYVKVYFKSQFNSRHNQIKIPYGQVRRVAEVRAEKKGKKWLTYIMRVAFVTEIDSAKSPLNDVLLTSDSIAVNGGKQIAEVISEAENLRNKERETERKALEEYNSWLTTGDKAFASRDYDKALEAYTEAEKRNDFDDLLPRRKIYQVKRAFEKEKQTQVELLREYLAKGSIAQKKRNYTEAVGYYKKAFELKPDSLALGATIKQLNQKSSVKTELDEKYNSGKYAEVIKDYSKILRKEKSNSDYYLGRGLAYVMTNESDRALKDFTQSIELDFSNLAALKARAELFATKKDYPKAAADLTSYLNIDDSADDVFARRAKYRILTRNTAGAFEDYNKAVELSPKYPGHYFSRGILFFQTENYPNAVTDFSNGLKLDNKHSESYYNRGLAYVKLSQPEQAGQDFAQLRKLGINADQQQQIGLIVNHYFEKAFKSLADKKYENAIKEFDETIFIKPDISEAWYHRGQSFTALSDTLAALESYDRAISFRPDYSQAFFERAQLWFGLGKFEKAAADYRKSYEINPLNYLANAGEAHAYYEQKWFDKAIVSYQFIKINEKKIGKSFSDSVFANIYNQLGVSLFLTGQTAKAIEEFDRAIARNENFSDAYCNRGKAYEKENSLRRAVADFKKSAGLDGKTPIKYQFLGNAQYKEENFEDAILSFSEAIKLDADNRCCMAVSKLKRGDCYYALKQYRQATDDYESAFAIDSVTHIPDAFYNTGIAFLYQRQTDRSIKFLSRITAKDLVKGQAYYGLACAYVQQKKPEQALAWFEKSFQTGTISRAYIRKDKLLESVDKAFANSSAFKELVNKNVIK